ncbi:MAG: hypothetical protein IPO07_16465 [Haliscomenobacter sp.]|nr:hypothetical protein [Haliscomenobacter sp.]MBK9490182.1 hypothetical protein [Haliscomenobacter sp.]
MLRVKGTDTILTIFNHRTYLPELQVGQEEFWGLLQNETKDERMKNILSILHKDYAAFPYESVNWLTDIFQKIPFEERVNMKVHHCCMRFIRADVRLLSEVPVQVDEKRNFRYTLNYIQNIQHLIKKITSYWLNFLWAKRTGQTFHSGSKTPNAIYCLQEKKKCSY